MCGTLIHIIEMYLQKGFSDQLTLEWFPPEVLIQIFSFLDARFLQETVSQLCSKFYAVISNEAYWKSRIKKKWPSNSQFRSHLRLPLIESFILTPPL